MAKVEVLREKSSWIVQVTFREPFEYFFEIAVHQGRFDHPRDASRLADRVRAAIKKNGWASPSIVLDSDRWGYRSSAYDGRYHKKVEPIIIPASLEAMASDAIAD